MYELFHLLLYIFLHYHIFILKFLFCPPSSYVYIVFQSLNVYNIKHSWSNVHFIKFFFQLTRYSHILMWSSRLGNALANPRVLSTIPRVQYSVSYVGSSLVVFFNESMFKKIIVLH